jgi:hypothetical protein
MSLMKMPIAPPIPPTQGPKSTAKTAGIMTTGQNLTSPNPGVVIGMMKKNMYPKTAYNAALIAVAATSKGFKPNLPSFFQSMAI